MSFLTKLLGKSYRTYTWEQYCSPILMELPEEARKFLFAIKIYPDEAEAFFFVTTRVLYIEFKKTEIGPALNKICQRARALQLQKQGTRPRSIISHGPTSALISTGSTSSAPPASTTSTAGENGTASGRDKKTTPMTAQQVMSAIEAQFAMASSSTAASIVSADTPLSSSLKRSRRLSCDDIILKTSGRASNSALQELKANVTAAAIASGVPALQSSSSQSSTESLDRSSEPLTAHLSLSPRTNTPITPPIATSASAPVPSVSATPSSSSSSSSGRIISPQDSERDPSKIKERERVRRKLKRGLKSKLRASHCYTPPTPELIASVTITPLPRSNPEPASFPDPVAEIQGYWTHEDPRSKLRKWSKVGYGRFGVVHSAVNSSGTKLALKFLKARYSENVEDISREIWMLKSSAHPNIVALHAAYLHEDRVWIAMEFCEHCSLTSLIKPKSLRERHIAFITGEVLNALQHLHGMNRIHRDIKAENILVCGDGSLKIADFGLTTQIDDSHPGLGVAGSRYWIAPEMVMKQPYTTSADIWSLGCVVYELFAGGPPFCEYDSIKSWFRTITRGPAKLPASTKPSSALENFISRCLSLDPALRATATELLEHPFISKACSKHEVSRLLITSDSEQALQMV